MIPLTRPAVAPRSMEYLAAVVESAHRSGDGEFTKRAEQRLLALHPGSAEVLLTTSCTHALELAVRLVGVGPGDEVIVPAFCFPSVANAVLMAGATVRFADADPDHLGSSVASIRERLNARTKAVIALHYGGVCVDGVEELAADLAAAGVALIEDNAHGLFGTVGGRALGTLGSMSTLSFHDTKNVSAGECGALVINDPSLVATAAILREKGTNRRAFMAGEIDRYGWVAVGSSWVPSEFVAAVLCAALEDSDRTQNKRHEIWLDYQTELGEWAAGAGMRLMSGSIGHPANTFHVVAPASVSASGLLHHCRGAGVGASFHYTPLHMSPVLGPRAGTDACPVAEEVAARIVRLPLWPDMTATERASVVDAIRSFAEVGLA